jgi:hypothetical protein
MKVFHCDRCDAQVFFESVRCVRCHSALAWWPTQQRMIALDPPAASDSHAGDWPVVLDPSLRSHRGRPVRLCGNYVGHGICNWALPAGDNGPLCSACRLTRLVPPLADHDNHRRWHEAEIAKRRVLVQLDALGLPLDGGAGARPPVFEFKVRQPDDLATIGHADGVITLDVAESDDDERERRRLALNEPLRTVLGHLRHELGHYWWDRLIAASDRLGAFREIFGDERADYRQALHRHYEYGPPSDWGEHFVSAYASTHPWEDWAETWTHYLHMHEAVDTAQACGLRLTPARADEPALPPLAERADTPAFDHLIGRWFPLSYVLNALNRGLGLRDAYPFLLNDTVIAKLRFVHQTIAQARYPGENGPIMTTPSIDSADVGRLR